MPDVAILAYVSCGNVVVRGTDQRVNWSPFFEIRVRLSAELAIMPRSRFLARSEMKPFHEGAPNNWYATTLHIREQLGKQGITHVANPSL